MENRRIPTPNAPRPFNRRKNFQKPEERPFGYKRFPTKDSKSQTRDENFYSRNERLQKKEGKFDERNENYKSTSARFNLKGRFTPKSKSSKTWEKDKKPRIISDMQVTDGKHIGKYLQSTTSQKVRPTARRIREVMFRILLRRVRAGRFLDLCAGSGTVGIEAISRGALIGTFVERSAKMCSFIKKNMEALHIKNGHGEVVEMEAIPFLKQMEKRRRFWDVVFFDPPYDTNYDEVLVYFSRGTALKPNGILVIEHHAEMFFPEKFGVMNRWRVIAQGETSLSFYERK
jgi:16S rRNA (guanine(966)-N(2))-methyltransferase RsmD